MAEIKSSIDIAMARAAAMMGAAVDEDKEQGQKAGEVAARRFLSGDVDAAEMGELLEQRPQGQRGHALRGAVERLLEGVSAGDDKAVEGLRAMPLPQAAEQLAALVSAADERFRAAGTLYTKMAGEMARQLEAVGISGTAVSPNPLSHPQLELRMRQALDEHMVGVQKAADDLLAAMG